jgi:hypothetical protein
VQAWFPLCLFQHLQDLFHHNIAPFFRQMQPIPATQKLSSSYSGRWQEQTANNSREACSHPVLPLLHGMPEINHLQVHLLAQSYASIRVQTAGFVGPDDLTQYSTTAHIICSVPCVQLYGNKPLDSPYNWSLTWLSFEASPRSEVGSSGKWLVSSQRGSDHKGKPTVKQLPTGASTFQEHLANRYSTFRCSAIFLMFPMYSSSGTWGPRPEEWAAMESFPPK